MMKIFVAMSVATLSNRVFSHGGRSQQRIFYVHLLRNRADLVVVDVGLPGEDGMSLVGRLAAQGVPTVLMTARADLDSRISGLDAGALQYFVKPVDMQELVAGIRSLLRSKGFQASDGDIKSVVSWQIDTAAYALRAPNQQSVQLTTRELELLSCLLQRPGVLVSKQALVQAVGGSAPDHDHDFHRVESVLTRLRRKTLDSTGLVLPVRAVFGKGLVFAA